MEVKVFFQLEKEDKLVEIKKLRIVWSFFIEFGSLGSGLEEGIKVFKFKWFFEDEISKFEVFEDVDLDLKKLRRFFLLKERSRLFIVVVLFRIVSVKSFKILFSFIRKGWSMLEQSEEFVGEIVVETK